MNDQYTDARLEKVETVTINFETFKKALRRNYLEDNNIHDRTFVLRLYPPFEAEMEAEYYESVKGQHYNNEWEEKPVHISPEWIIMEETPRGFNSIINWDTVYTIESNFSEETIEERGGVQDFLRESHEMFWDELKTILPETMDLGKHVPMSKQYEVDINWVFEE